MSTEEKKSRSTLDDGDITEEFIKKFPDATSLLLPCAGKGIKHNAILFSLCRKFGITVCFDEHGVRQHICVIDEVYDINVGGWTSSGATENMLKVAQQLIIHNQIMTEMETLLDAGETGESFSTDKLVLSNEDMEEIYKDNPKTAQFLEPFIGYEFNAISHFLARKWKLTVTVHPKLYTGYVVCLDDTYKMNQTSLGTRKLCRNNFVKKINAMIETKDAMAAVDEAISPKEFISFEEEVKSEE